MAKETFTEKQLLQDLDSSKAHADEMAEPLPKELDPLERLRGSVKEYKRPFDSVWEEDAGPEEEDEEGRHHRND